MIHPITIEVLAFGELFQMMLNALASFMKQDFFTSFLKLTALIGIILVSVGYLKRRDPTLYLKWMVAYVLILELLITPKTDVMVYDIASQKALAVDEVPLVFALVASVLTQTGLGLAQTYDLLLTLPDDLKYTKTGSLFGSKLIQGAHDFRILNPLLKQEMNEYFKQCVVGDIQINHKYSVSDLASSTNIYDLITKKPSPIRLVNINEEKKTCLEASLLLKSKLDEEIKKAYTLFGIHLFHEAHNNYEALFEARLASTFGYFQHMTDSSSNIFLQSMMINAMGDGLKEYQAFTNSTAGIINNQVTKSEVQHRFAWAIAGEKAAWFLPILHSVLLIMLFCIFPIILVMTTLPNGVQIFKGYIQFFVSLQFWPVLFAILNSVMTFYGEYKSQGYGALTMMSIEKMDEFHADLTGVSGYLMLMIPFLAKGLISNLSEAFNNLATSMTNHLQGSAMSVANEPASGSFSFGQTSFYNTSANTFSANKHDSNWSHFHGMRTEQLATGVTRTQTASGETIFDVSAGMSKGALSLHGSKSLMASLNESYDESQQTSRNAHLAYQKALTQSMHHASQLSQLSGHDLRLGKGVSAGESTHFQSSLSQMKQIASDVAKRKGVSEDEAMNTLLSAHADGRVHIPRGLTTPLKAFTKGAIELSGSVGGQYSRSSQENSHARQSFDEGFSAREAKDFNASYNQVKQFVENHHFDETTSKGAHLLNQLGDDLRKVKSESQNYDVSLAKSERISEAQNYVKSHGSQVTTHLDQSFAQFVASKVGASHQEALYANPSSQAALSELNQLGEVFLHHKRDEIIAQFGATQKHHQIESSYQSGKDEISHQKENIFKTYDQEKKQIHDKAKPMHLDQKEKDDLLRSVHEQTQKTHYSLLEDYDDLSYKKRELLDEVHKNMTKGQENARRGLFSRKTRNHDEP